MHIVLLILKILLIIVLSIIGLVLLLALLVLFAPVRYKMYVRKQDDIWAKLTARWLGFVLCFKLVYDQGEGLNYRLRLFGGTLFGSEKKEPRRGKKSARPADDYDDNSIEAGNLNTDIDNTDIDNTANNIEDIENTTEEDLEFERNFPSADSEDREFLLEDKEFEKKTEGIFGKIGRKIDSLCKHIADKYKNISEKVSGLKKKKDGYTKLVNNVRTKEAFRVAKVQLIALLRHLKPSVLKGQITYGTGDPASTGQNLGYMSVLFPLYYDHIDITPDFENEILEGDFMMKGRIIVWSVGWCVLKVIWNKNVKITISRFKKISGGN